MFSSMFTVFKGFNLSPKASGLASIFGTTHKFDKNQKRGPDGKWIKYGVGLAGKLSIEQNHRNYNVDDVVLRALDGDPAVVKKYNEAISEVEADVRAGKSTNVIHSRNKDGTGGYTKARLKLHRKILDHFFKNEDDLKPTNPPPTFIVLGGRGGSGKSNFDKNSPHGAPSKFGVYDSKKSLLIDPDQIKELLPEYDPQKAYLVHEESAAIADKLHYLARKKGLNVVMDITLRSYHGSIMSKFKKAGYRTEAHFMHRQPELALHSAVRRWNRKTIVKNPLTGEAKVFPKGRLVPPKVVEGNTHNEHNFDRMARMADHWSVVSNTSPDGFSGVLVGTKPKPVRKLDSFAVVLKANPYHEPAGSPKGGQFTSKEKLGYRVATSVQFAAMLKDIGASSPHAPWLKQQALATNLKAKSHGALDLELAYDWLKAGHSKATINEVGIDLTDDDLKAMAHWQSKSKAAATSLKTLFDKHYTKHYAQVQDAIATFGADSAQVKKLNKVGVSWLAQAYKFGASPQQVKEGLEGVEKAYKDAKAKKVAGDAFAPGKGPYATLPSTKHMAENNLATLKDYHGKVVSALGADHPHAKAAESEVEMAQIHLDNLKSVAANVGAPAIGGSSAPKFQSSNSLSGALNVYHALAGNYYKLKASGKDQSDPAVQAAHSEWEKSKEVLKSRYGWGAPELSKEAHAAKDMASGMSTSSPGLDKLKLQEKTSLMGSLKKMYKEAELDGTPLDYDLEKKALALGVDQTDISQLAQAGKKEAIEEKKTLKSNALNSAKSAAFNKAKALDLHGKDSPEYAEAVAAHVATVSANLKHASGSEFDFYSDTGEAAYALFKAEQKKLKATYGSVAADAAKYDSETFSMVSGMSHNKTTNHEIPYSDFLDHAKSITKNLADEENQALYSYTGSGYKKINKDLGAAAYSAKSGGQPEVGDSAVFKKIKNLDSALARSTLGSNTVVNRNMAGKWFWDGLGIDPGKAVSSPVLGGLTDSDLKNLEGRVYKENAFSSTSIKEGNSAQFQSASTIAGTVKMVIRVGKDKPALYVDHISANSGEQEVILPRGTLYVIRSITRQGKDFIANVDMMGAAPEVITHKGKAYTGVKK